MSRRISFVGIEGGGKEIPDNNLSFASIDNFLRGRSIESLRMRFEFETQEEVESAIMVLKNLKPCFEKKE